MTPLTWVFRVTKKTPFLLSPWGHWFVVGPHKTTMVLSLTSIRVPPRLTIKVLLASPTSLRVTWAPSRHRRLTITCFRFTLTLNILTRAFTPVSLLLRRFSTPSRARRSRTVVTLNILNALSSQRMVRGWTLTSLRTLLLTILRLLFILVSLMTVSRQVWRRKFSG